MIAGRSSSSHSSQSTIFPFLHARRAARFSSRAGTLSRDRVLLPHRIRRQGHVRNPPCLLVLPAHHVSELHPLERAREAQHGAPEARAAPGAGAVILLHPPACGVVGPPDADDAQPPLLRNLQGAEDREHVLRALREAGPGLGVLFQDPAGVWARRAEDDAEAEHAAGEVAGGGDVEGVADGAERRGREGSGGHGYIKATAGARRRSETRCYGPASTSGPSSGTRPARTARRGPSRRPATSDHVRAARSPIRPARITEPCWASTEAR